MLWEIGVENDGVMACDEGMGLACWLAGMMVFEVMVVEEVVL